MKVLQPTGWPSLGMFFDATKWLLWREKFRPLIFGVRFWLSVCLALYVAYSLELEAPAWAGASASIISLPHVGASFRKSWFRIIGTMVGAGVMIILSAWFPQDRFWFLGGLTLWLGLSAFNASIFRNFASYGAALSGYTVAVLSGAVMGASGGVNVDTLFVIVTERTSEVCIGISCAAFVQAITETGRARDKLEHTLSTLFTDILFGFIATLQRAGIERKDIRPLRRALLKRISAIDSLLDETIGESFQLKLNSPIMQRGVDGLFTALVGWRALDAELFRITDKEGHHLAQRILKLFPTDLLQIAGDPARHNQHMNSHNLHQHCQEIIARLHNFEAVNPDERLFADKTAEVLCGLCHMLNGLILLTHGDLEAPVRGFKTLRFPDLLPGLLNALRAMAAVALAIAFWLVSGWSNGMAAVVLAAVMVTLLAPRQEMASAGAMIMVVGVIIGIFMVLFARIVILPAIPENFLGLSLVLGAFLVPIAALSSMTQYQVLAILNYALAMNFVTLLHPTNPMVYDNLHYLDSSVGYIVGSIIGLLSFRLIPPLTPAYRCKRLLDLSLRDMKKLAANTLSHNWYHRIYGRLVEMPEKATNDQRVELIVVLQVGNEIINLRQTAAWLGVTNKAEPVLQAIAAGDWHATRQALIRFDELLADMMPTTKSPQTLLRARVSTKVMTAAVLDHRDFFMNKPKS